MLLDPFLVIDGKPYFPKWPRQYADAIARLNKPGQLPARQEALKRVPEEYLELTKKHLDFFWNHPKGNTNG